jgi:hypothetical protein
MHWPAKWLSEMPRAAGESKKDLTGVERGRFDGRLANHPTLETAARHLNRYKPVEHTLGSAFQIAVAH